MSRVIALTGGIASGKSTIRNYLEQKGAYIIDADSIVKELQSAGSAILEAIAREFGREYLLDDGALNRQKLGELVFSDAGALEKLNSITHPAVYAEINTRIEHAVRKGMALIVAEIPLLIESGRQNEFCEIWLASAGEETRIRRLAARSGLSRIEAKRRLESQLPEEQKRPFAHHIIDTDMELARLYENIDMLVERNFNE